MSTVPFNHQQPSPTDWKTHRDTWERSPANWLVEADRWRASTQILVDKLLRLGWPSPSPKNQSRVIDLERSTQLLLGYSIECLVKGLSLARTCKLARFIEHHVEQEVRAIIGCSPAEIDLFERLEKSIVTAGRYPVPDAGMLATIDNNPFQLRPQDLNQFDEIWE